jgi:hypothetical protein
MASNYVLPVKLSSTVVPVEVDFISQLQGDDAVTAIEVTVSVFSGVDADPDAILSGSPTLAQNRVTQVITGGVVGVMETILLSTLISPL